MQARTVKNVVVKALGGALLAVSIVAWGGASDSAAQAGATQQCAPSRLEIALAELDYLLLEEVAAPAERAAFARAHVEYLLLDEVIAGHDGARDIEPGCAHETE